MMETNKIHISDCIDGMKLLPDESVHCCVTSPPYYGLRNYNVDGQIGLEETPELFISKMVNVFEEVRRVLKKDGTLWLNIGDSYAGSWGNYGGQNRGNGVQRDITTGSQVEQKAYDGKEKWKPPTANKISGVKPKDLIGIPWMLAFALRSAGWYLRQDIIWHKPNPMPESVTDRCTKAHEYIFLLSKSAKYYYDHEAIKTEIADASVQRLLQNVADQNGSIRVPGKTNGPMKAVLKGYQHRGEGDKKLTGHSGNFDASGNLIGDGKANKKSVWTVTTKPFSEAHFATFPEDLIVDCIKAGCPEGGIVLDPFGGAGTTALVAKKLMRKYILFELNPEYVSIAQKRIHAETAIYDLIFPST
jgi:DNA modification methylase